MAQKALSKEEMRQALEAVARHGNIAAAARSLGVIEETFRSRVGRARSAQARGELDAPDVVRQQSEGNYAVHKPSPSAS